jgi:hypothetical protein
MRKLVMRGHGPLKEPILRSRIAFRDRAVIPAVRGAPSTIPQGGFFSCSLLKRFGHCIGRRADAYPNHAVAGTNL